MSRKDFGCFFCRGKSVDFGGVCDTCGEAINVGHELVALRFVDYTPDLASRASPDPTGAILGRGFHGWTLRVRDEYQPFAMKVIPKHRLAEQAPADAEVRALVACSPHRNIARFFRPLSLSVEVRGRQVEVRCLLFELIRDAIPLSHFLTNDAIVATRSDVVAILSGIASGLSRLHTNGLWHDDLHDDNVLVRRVAQDENLSERFEPKLIDFGSVKPFEPDTPERGERSDYTYLSKHVFALVAKFQSDNRSQLTPTDRTFVSYLTALGHRLADRNVSRRNLSPVRVHEELRDSLSGSATGHSYPSFGEMKEQTGVSLVEPLANSNALNLAPQDIALLFRDSLGWKERIEKSEPVVIVGPRGCGKTMLLRYLAVTSSARPLETEGEPEAVGARLAGMRHIGFLVSVGQLRTPFLRSTYKALERDSAERAEDFCREYLNLNLAYAVVRAFLWLGAERIVPLTQDDADLVAALMERLFGQSDSPRSRRVEEYAERIDRRVVDLSNLRDSPGYEATAFCRDDVPHLLAETIRRTQLAAGKEVWFLIDDYSVTVLPDFALKAFNPVLYRPSSEVRMKVSSEGDGPILTDSLGRKYREGRELTKVNLGEVYFQADEEQCREFFEAILDARFRVTGKGSIGELRRLLGEHRDQNRFGEYISSLSKPGLARFHGFQLLCRLCSGDVSFIIELLHALSPGAWDRPRERMNPKRQDEIVKAFAQRQLSDLRVISDHGEKVYDIALRLGKLIKEYLLKSKGKERPDERLRIEVEGVGELEPAAQQMHEVLLRHSVLIPGGAGKDRAGLPTKKLYVRRLFAPCFPFSPNRRGSIAITLKEYERWLLDPRKIWQKPREKLELPLDDGGDT